MHPLRYVLCDVFTSSPLQGNAVAVFTNGSGVDSATMQAIAREMNLSETVFVLPPEGDAHARLRIFTPTVEVPFAGHPTLGAAFVLAVPLSVEALRLETARGLIHVRVERDGATPRFGWMLQLPPQWEFPEEADAMLAALGVERSLLPVTRYLAGIRHVVVQLASAEAVMALRPNLTALEAFGMQTFCAVALRDTRATVRVFVPAGGIAEDPATGSAAGPIAVHLVRHGLLESGQHLEIHQGAAVNRPSVLFAVAELEGDRVTRMEVGGAAVIVGRGELKV
jgi:trans-2,3-dihydro-3-hydroxyanthranilate isomerase